MIVDSSALIAMAMGEPDANRLAVIMLGHAIPRISAANLLETYMVIDRRRGALAKGTIAEGVTPLGLIVEPVTDAQVHIARQAFAQYGKASGHPPGSTTATALLMHWPGPWTSLCSLSGTTSRRLTLRARRDSCSRCLSVRHR